MALIVGIGNPTRSDDGAGLAAAQVIARARDDVEIIEAQQLTPEIAERVAAHAVVIFLDASVRVDCVTVSDVSPRAEAGGSHGGSPAQVVALGEALYGARPATSVLVEIPARDLGFGERLSAETAAAVEEAAQLSLGILAAHAHADRA